MVLTPPSSSTSQFLHTNKCFVKKGEPRTHISQDAMGFGGKICVEDDMMEELLACIAMDLSTGSPLYLHEVLTEVFRFFVDLDLCKKLTEIDDDVLFEIGTLMSETMKKCFPSASATTLIFLILTRPGSANCHIVFPNLLVDAPGAKKICRRLFHAFQMKFGPKQPWYNKESLEDTLDTKPYNSTLRMVGSAKCHMCTSCDRKTDDCITCEGNGYIHEEDKEYAVTHAFFDGEFNFELLKNVTVDYETILRYTTLRRNDTATMTPGYMAAESDDDEEIEAHKKPANKTGNKNATAKTFAKSKKGQKSRDSSHGDPHNQAKKQKKKRKFNNKYSAKTGESAEENGKATWLATPKEDNQQLWNTLSILIASVDPLFTNAIIHSVLRNRAQQPSIYVAFTESRGCLNLTTASRQHNSEKTRFRFVMHGRKVVPKCGCKCETVQNRKHGRCMDYVPVPVRIAEEHVAVLFPHAAKLTAVSSSVNSLIRSTANYYKGQNVSSSSSLSNLKTGPEGAMELPLSKRRCVKTSVYIETQTSHVARQEEYSQKLKAMSELQTLNNVLAGLTTIMQSGAVRRHRSSRGLVQTEDDNRKGVEADFENNF